MKSEVTIRPAEISDALGIARVHVNAWRETYKGIIPDSVLDALSYEELTAQRLDNIQKLKERRQCCLIAVSEDG